MTSLKTGLFGIGLDVYWPQFPGLKERLESYLQRVQNRLEHPGVVVVNPGLIDTPERAFEAGHALRAEKRRREHRNTDPRPTNTGSSRPALPWMCVVNRSD
jgi:L-arabinose isomerase